MGYGQQLKPARTGKSAADTRDRKMDIYQYYRRRMEEIWRGLTLSEEVRTAFEEKYLEPVACLLGGLQADKERLQELERKTEIVIREAEESG